VKGNAVRCLFFEIVEICTYTVWEEGRVCFKTGDTVNARFNTDESYI